MYPFKKYISIFYLIIYLENIFIQHNLYINIYIYINGMHISLTDGQIAHNNILTV